MRKKLLVYNIHTKEPSRSRLNPEERDLINEMSFTSSTRYERLITDYYNASSNKQIFLYRMDELINSYRYNQFEVIKTDIALQIINQLLLEYNRTSEFSEYLTSNGILVVNTLLTEIKELNPKKFAAFLFAMDKLNLVRPNALTDNKAEMINTFNKAFKTDFIRQSVSFHLNKKEHEDKTAEYISFFVEKINAILK